MYGDPHVLGRKVSRDPLPLAPSAVLTGRSRITTPRRTRRGAGRTGLRRRPEQQTQHAGERQPRDAADAGGRGTRRTHAPLGSTLGSLAVGELRGDSWRFVEILEPRSTLASLAVGRWRRAGSATSLVRQSGVHKRWNPTRQPTHELTVSTGTENSDRYGTASDEMRCGFSSGTLMHSPSSNLAR